MPILHLALTVALMGITGCCLLGALCSMLQPTEGMRALGKRVAPVAGLLLGWWSLVLSFTFSLPAGHFVAVIYWLFFVLGPVMYSPFFVGDLFGFWHRSVCLQTADVPRREKGAILSIAHLSDFHIPANFTIEEGLHNGAVLDFVRAAVEWALARADYVMITGDITDSGHSSEWQLYKSLSDSLSQEQRSKLLLIPGNHDLSLTLRFGAYGAGLETADYDSRCRAFAKAVFCGCPASWVLITPGGRHSVARVMAGASEYIKVYDGNPPWTNVGIPEAGLPLNILEMSGEILSALSTVDEFGLWPTRGAPFFRDLIDLAYPMILAEKNGVMIVGLNSCLAPADSIVGSGFGRIGKAQLLRLEAVVSNLRENEQLIVMVHHHIGVPRDLRRGI